MNAFIHRMAAHVYRLLPDILFLKIKFYFRTKYVLNINSPKTFNEKLQWLKIYYRKPIMTTMVDKYAAKEYVAHIIGDHYIIPTIGVWGGRN